MDISEKQLLEKIANGDEKAFELVFKKYYAVLCCFAMRFLPEKPVTEEIVQEFFLKFWENRKSISIETSLKSYFFRSVQNRSLDYIKHLKIRDKYSQHKTIEIQNTNQEENNDLIAFDLEDAVEKAVGKLPPQCREIFCMSRLDGLKYREIAEVLHISIKTVEAQMGKALKRLRKDISAYKA